MIVGDEGVIDAGENDKFSQIQLVAGAAGVNYNFGEADRRGARWRCNGRTATIGFWQNKNGQKLIKSLNGDEKSTLLADWLSATFSNMYGGAVGMDNIDVADTFKQLFKRNASNSPGGPPKLDAQVMATARQRMSPRNRSSRLTLPPSRSTSRWSQAWSRSALTSPSAVSGLLSFNVGDAGAAFGVANNSDVLIIDLLLAADSMAHDGILYDIDEDGEIEQVSLKSLRVLANDVFSAINELGIELRPTSP